MSLKLSKNNAPAYDYYSEGDGSDPVSVSADIDGSGAPATVESTIVTAYLVATQFSYSQITVTPINEEAGINWKVSLDNAVWSDSVAPADMNATGGDQTVPVYFKAIVDNDGSVGTSINVGADIEIARKESPI